jgi:hypothetical protein
VRGVCSPWTVNGPSCICTFRAMEGAPEEPPMILHQISAGYTPHSGMAWMVRLGASVATRTPGSLRPNAPRRVEDKSVL